ncbi:MAG: hypothetical protein IT226_04665 [Flavobacteriales bacterium]|nr:hypothetical protein [Flavobacteriales bacterium]
MAADRMAAETGTYTPERFCVELMRVNALVNDKHVARFVPGRSGQQLVLSIGDQVEVARGKRPMLVNAIGRRGSSDRG